GQTSRPIHVTAGAVPRSSYRGVASATSGDGPAGPGGAGGGVTQPVASGSARATGAQVQSTVDLHSSAAVRVNGDNYNPISIVLNLAANLVNWGAGLARSGNAQAGGAASSGAVTASGLQVMNLVGLWADASVDIQGNNYAPIFIRISFITNIENRGVAGASSGNVAAGKAGSSTTRSASAPSTGPGRST